MFWISDRGMRLALRFLQAPRAHQGVLLSAFWLVCAIRLALWTIPYKTVVRLLGMLRSGTAQDLDRDQLVWAVAAASRYVPRASCLTQALAAQTLLRRHGYASTLQIGVAKGPANRLEAHSWLEADGEVLIGGGGLERYARLRNSVQ